MRAGPHNKEMSTLVLSTVVMRPILQFNLVGPCIWLTQLRQQMKAPLLIVLLV